MARCIGFTMKDVAAAYEHMEFELVEAYGDSAYGHYLHTWDDGGRSLFRCRNCGGYVLAQKSEYHGLSDDDSYYRDYFPVDSPQEADELNRKYNGFEIENRFPEKYIMWTNGELSWSR